MQYHQAAYIGQERARKSQHKLFEYSGFAFLTKTVKQSGEQFEPVGDEDLITMTSSEDKVLVIICDADGYAKAQTKPLLLEQAKKIYEKMLKDGFKEFTGEAKTVK
ncbi:MAG: hypothetical protein ACE5J2_00730 [Nitrososphaerales archaeon]